MGHPPGRGQQLDARFFGDLRQEPEVLEAVLKDLDAAFDVQWSAQAIGFLYPWETNIPFGMRGWYQNI